LKTVHISVSNLIEGVNVCAFKFRWKGKVKCDEIDRDIRDRSLIIRLYRN
jgi:hypothetical protein